MAVTVCQSYTRWDASLHERARPMTAKLGFRTGVILLDDMDLFNRVANRVSSDHGMKRDHAGMALDQAILFVAVAGLYPGKALSPSEPVDKAWDTFILYSLAYSAFCERVAGRYVHHTPLDELAGSPVTRDGRRLYTPYETARIIAAEGFVVRPEMWPADASAASKANCTNCYSGDHEGEAGP